MIRFSASISISVHTLENIPLRNNFLLFVNHSYFSVFVAADWIQSQIGNALICPIPNSCFVSLDELVFVWKSSHNNHSSYVLFVMRTMWQMRWRWQTINISFRSYSLCRSVMKFISCNVSKPNQRAIATLPLFRLQNRIEAVGKWTG